jgi:hypothetical protein
MKQTLYYKYLNWRWWKLNCKLSHLFNGHKVLFPKHILDNLHKIESKLNSYIKKVNKTI